MANLIDAELATKLLASFKNPVSGKDENYEIVSTGGVKLNGIFISNSDFLEKQHVSGGYVTTYDSQDNAYGEVHVEWSGFDGIEDASVADRTSYTFPSEGRISGWRDTATEVKRHLKEITES